MGWGRQDDGWHDHPKALASSLGAHGVFWGAISYANRHRTDGKVSRDAARMLARGDDTLVAELVRVGLWECNGHGYVIHDFLRYNESAREVKKRQQDGRLRVQRHRDRKRESNVLQPRSGNAPVTASRPVPSRPRSHTEKKREDLHSEAGFADFWTSYPRHTKRKAALKAWVKLAPDSALQGRILASLAWQRQLEDWTKEAGQYVPHASTYLNEARWEDEPPNARPALSDEMAATVREVFKA